MKNIKLIVAALFFCATAIAQSTPLTKEQQRVQDSITKNGASKGGFDDFYQNLVKEKQDTSKSFLDNILANGANPKSPSNVNNTFNTKLFEEQIIALTKDPKDCFKNAKVVKEDNAGMFDYGTNYESNISLEGVGKGKIVRYRSGNITYYAETGTYLSKDDANKIVENVFTQLKKSTNLPFTYQYSEPYNVDTRRLISFTFMGKDGKDITLSLDIDMTTSDNSNTTWQVVVRVTKNC